MPVRTCVTVALGRASQILRWPGRSIHLTYGEPACTVRVFLLVLRTHRSQRVNHTGTHTYRVHPDVHNLIGNTLERPLVMLQSHGPGQIVHLLRRGHGVHPTPGVLDPAQLPSSCGYRVGIVTEPRHVHTQDQRSISVHLLVGVDEGLSQQRRGEQAHLPVLGKLRQDLGLVPRVILTPRLETVIHPAALHQDIRQRVRYMLPGEVGGIVRVNGNTVPQGSVSVVAEGLSERGFPVVGVPDGQDTTVGRGGDRLHTGPEFVHDPAGLVDYNENITTVDALESMSIPVLGFTPKAHDLAVVQLPDVSPGDLTRKRKPALSGHSVVLTHLLPQNGIDLTVSGGCGDDDGLDRKSTRLNSSHVAIS